MMIPEILKYVRFASLSLMAITLLTDCSEEDNHLDGEPALETLLQPVFQVGPVITRSIVNGTATSATEDKINEVKLFVTTNDNGYTLYPGVGTDGLSTFMYKDENGSTSWSGTPPVLLSNVVVRIYAYCPANASFTRSGSSTDHTISVRIPSEQTFAGDNNWNCSATDYLYGSASGTVGEASPVTASNADTGGASSSTFKPEIYLQHALAQIVFTMQKGAGLTVDNTYDYVKEIRLSTTDATTKFRIVSSKGTMSLVDGTVTTDATVQELKFTPTNGGTSSSTAVICGIPNNPKQVGYGLVAPLTTAPSNLTVIAVIGKKDNTEYERELSATLTPMAWKKGRKYTIKLTLSNRAITVQEPEISDWTQGWSGGDSGSTGTGEMNPS